MGATRKSTLGRNDVVTIVWIFQHHLLGCVETYLAQPYSEVGMQTLVEELTQFILGDTEGTRKCKHVHVAVLITQIGTPAVKAILNKLFTLVRKLL